jgi:ABC-type molybdate transport system substrate-binding protein
VCDMRNRKLFLAVLFALTLRAGLASCQQLSLSSNMKDRGRYTEVPINEYPPIEQACVILGSSKNKDTARQFLSFFKKPAIADLLKSYGFDVQGGSAK